MDAIQHGLLAHKQVAELCSYNFEPVRLKGLTNSSWLIKDSIGISRCLRIPGSGTEKYIDRREEPIIISLIKDAGITPETHFYSDGIKTTFFMHTHKVATPADGTDAFFAALDHQLQKLHAISYSVDYGLPETLIVDQINKFHALYTEKGGKPLPENMVKNLLTVAEKFDSQPFVLCHRDLAWENILVDGPDGANMLLIDFEYSGFAHPLWEYASFILESDMNDATRTRFTQVCGITSKEELHKLGQMEMLVDLVWGMWGFCQGYFDYAQNKFKRLTINYSRYQQLGNYS